MCIKAKSSISGVETKRDVENFISKAFKSMGIRMTEESSSDANLINLRKKIKRHSKLKEEVIMVGDLRQNVAVRRLWEVEDFFKCPLIGMYIDDKKALALFKKMKIKLDKDVSSYSLHKKLMSYMDTKNDISLKIENYLYYKNKIFLQKYLSLSEDEFLNHWNRLFSVGKIKEIFFVACLKKDLSPLSLSKIFGDIHMLSHLNVDLNLKLRRELNIYKVTCKKMGKSISSYRLMIRNFKKKLKQRTNLKNCNKYNIDTDRMKKIARENMILKKEVYLLTSKLNSKLEQEKKVQRQITKLKKENKKLKKKLADLKIKDSKTNFLGSELGALEQNLYSCLECAEKKGFESWQCEKCPRRVLIVGGITKLKHLYRELVEKVGYEFDYHDGYIKGGKDSLVKKVKSSDLVICPVDCNSHGACSVVKKLCKKYNKSLKILSKSSVSRVAASLN